MKTVDVLVSVQTNDGVAGILRDEDGALEPFCYLRADDYWVAVHQRTSQTLTIAAQHVEPASLDLRPLRDPIADLSWDEPL